jgi:hypothetical protein
MCKCMGRLGLVELAMGQGKTETMPSKQQAAPHSEETRGAGRVLDGLSRAATQPGTHGRSDERGWHRSGIMERSFVGALSLCSLCQDVCISTYHPLHPLHQAKMIALPPQRAPHIHTMLSHTVFPEQYATEDTVATHQLFLSRIWWRCCGISRPALYSLNSLSHQSTRTTYSSPHLLSLLCHLLGSVRGTCHFRHNRV